MADVTELLRSGDLFYGRAEYAKAEDVFRQAIAADPESTSGLLGLAMSLHMQGDYDEATYFYLSLVAIDPEDVDGQLNLGLVYQAQGRLDDAIEQLNRVVTLDKENAFAHLALGRALYERADFEAAAQSVSRAIELDPTDGEAYAYLGFVQEALGRDEESFASYQRAVELDPNEAYAHLNLARMLADRGDADGGILHGREALRIFTNAGSTELQAQAHWNIGWAYYAKDDWKESAAASRAALELDPTLTTVRFNLGLALLRDGETEEANHEYQRALIDLNDVWDADNGIEDLERAIEEVPDLHGAADILAQLRARGQELLERARADSRAVRS